MAQTVKQIIERSHRILGVTAAGEELDAAEITDGLVAIRGLIDRWSVEGAIVPVQEKKSFTTTNTKRIYTWGTGGDFNDAPPLRIISAWFNDGGTTDWPIKMADAIHHTHVRVKETVQRPGFMWADEGLTTWTIYLDHYPIDTTIVFIVDRALDTTQALTAASGFPLGFDTALAFNLAIEIAPEYGVPVTADIARLASGHKRALRNKWARVPLMRPDRGVQTARLPYTVESGPG